jgi:hypothetical protein
MWLYFRFNLSRCDIEDLLAQRGELPFPIARVPEQNVVEKPSTGGANQPFNEGMKNRDVGDRFYFVNFQYSQIGLPAMELKQRVVIGTEISRWTTLTLSIKDVIEHAAHGGGHRRHRDECRTRLCDA